MLAVTQQGCSQDFLVKGGAINNFLIPLGD